jgi:Flp pilus assembly protein TadD
MTAMRGPRIGPGLLVGVMAFALYLPAVRHGFIVYDDPLYVTENRHVLAGLTLEGLRWSLTATEGGNWHPLTWWSHMLAVDIFGTWAGGHHLVNALLHAAAAAALFRVLAGLTGAPLPSLAVAGLFAVHPLHVESVAWVSERKDALSALLWILTLGAWVKYLRRPGRGNYLSALGLFALGLMAKPMVVTLPVVLLLLDRWPLDRVRPAAGRGYARLLTEKLPLLLLAAAGAAVSLAAQRGIGALGRMSELPPEFRTALAGIRVANAVVSYAVYLGKAFWPADLAVYYPHPAHAIAGWTIALSGLALAGITVAAVSLRWKAPWFATGWAWYLLVLAPVIGIVQVGSQARADRYAYLPLIGIWLAVAWSMTALLRRRLGQRRPAAALAAAAFAALAALAVRQLGYWSDTETLFTHALAVTGVNHQAHRALGAAARREGRFAEAERHFREVLRSTPRSAGDHNRLGLALLGQGRPAEAAAAYREALRLAPGFVDARNNLGVALTALGELPEAERQLRDTLRLESGVAEIWANLGDTLARQGREEEAAEAYRQALVLKPGFAPVQARLERLPTSRNRLP